MTKRIAALALVLTSALMIALAPPAHARRGADDALDPPECEVEDGGIIVCE